LWPPDLPRSRGSRCHPKGIYGDASAEDIAQLELLIATLQRHIRLRETQIAGYGACPSERCASLEECEMDF
jgi:hypothetical protein